MGQPSVTCEQLCPGFGSAVTLPQPCLAVRHCCSIKRRLDSQAALHRCPHGEHIDLPTLQSHEFLQHGTVLRTTFRSACGHCEHCVSIVLASTAHDTVQVRWWQACASEWHVLSSADCRPLP